MSKSGFSTAGKHKHPQIVLGLLTGLNGYPLDYDIFEGNKKEGDTCIPILKHFKPKYEAERLVVVADLGLMSKEKLNVKYRISSIKHQLLNIELNIKHRTSNIEY